MINVVYHLSYGILHPVKVTAINKTDNIPKGVKALSDCLFCKITNKEIGSSIVFEDERIMAIHDIKPLTPVHILIIPKKHLASLEEMDESDIELLGYVQYRAREIARQVGLDGNYRVMTNCGPKAGQTIFHLHYHLLGGVEMD